MDNLLAREFSAKYLDYMTSPEWAELRREVIEMRGSECQICGRQTSKLHVHHLTYERLGEERDSDLLVVCRSCHNIIEKEKDFRRCSREIVAVEEQLRDAFDAAYDAFPTQEIVEEAVWLGGLSPSAEREKRFEELERLHDERGLLSAFSYELMAEPLKLKLQELRYMLRATER